MSDTNKFVAKQGIILKPFDGISQDAILKTNTQGHVVTGATFNDLSNTAHTHLVSDISDVSTYYYTKTQTNANFLSANTSLNYVSRTGDTMTGDLKITTLSGTSIRLVEASTGGTLGATKQIIDGYISNTAVTSILSSGASWTINGIYTGSTLTNTYQGTVYSDDNYFYFFIADNQPIRLIRG